MKKTLLLLLTITTFISCNSNKADYKYSQRKNIVSCDGVDNDLIKEVTYTFETFLMEHYDFKNQGNLEIPLRNYLNNAEVGLYPMVERFDDHIINFSKQLQKEEGLFREKFQWSTQVNLESPARCKVPKLISPVIHWSHHYVDILLVI